MHSTINNVHSAPCSTINVYFVKIVNNQYTTSTSPLSLVWFQVPQTHNEFCSSEEYPYKVQTHQINLVLTSLTIWPNSTSKGSDFYHNICVHMHVLVHVSFDPWNNGSYVCFLFVSKHIHWICNLPFIKKSIYSYLIDAVYVLEVIDIIYIQLFKRIYSWVAIFVFVVYLNHWLVINCVGLF